MNTIEMITNANEDGKVYRWKHLTYSREYGLRPNHKVNTSCDPFHYFNGIIKEEGWEVDLEATKTRLEMDELLNNLK